MSLYEKIATFVIALLVLVMIIFSYHEYKEPVPMGPELGQGQSAFDQSMGPDFIIGAYNKTLSSSVSGGPEDNCVAMQPVLVGTLHDIKERLEHAKVYNGTEDPFQVNNATLQLLCNKNATITLGGNASSTLVLVKSPFKRVVPQGSSADNIGTEVHIDATVVQRGGAMPATPTTFGDQLVPDRYLDDASTTSK